MTELEIALARAYLLASDQDPVSALIRSVKDLARLRRQTPGADRMLVADDRDASASHIPPPACCGPIRAPRGILLRRIPQGKTRPDLSSPDRPAGRRRCRIAAPATA